MTELTKDDYYEIEKILDLYAGQVSEVLCRFCNTSINWDGIKKTDSPLNDTIMDLLNTKKVIKNIRNKLEKIRKGD